MVSAFSSTMHFHLITGKSVLHAAPIYCDSNVFLPSLLNKRTDRRSKSRWNGISKYTQQMEISHFPLYFRTKYKSSTISSHD